MVKADNAEELALIAQEIGAEVVRGTVRYPGRQGGFEVGEMDTQELPDEVRDQQPEIGRRSPGSCMNRA